MSLFQYMDYIVNNGFEKIDNVKLTEEDREIIKQYIQNHNEYVQNSLGRKHDDLSAYYEEYFRSVDESTGKLYNDALLVKRAIDSKNWEIYEKLNHTLIEDYFKLQLYAY